MESSWAPIWKDLAKSFETLAQGVHVRRAIIWSIVGDLEFFSSEFQFPTAMSNYPCAYCSATNKFGDNEAPFTDFRAGAAWRGTQAMPEVDHPLMEVSGVSSAAIRLDLLHLIDLGCAAHLYGNLVWDLVEDHTEGPNRIAKLAKVNKSIEETYKSCKIPASRRLQRLNMSDVCMGGEEFPVLKHCKGRRIRYFSKVAVKLAAAHATTPWGQKRLAALQGMDMAYDSADSSTWGLEEFKKFKRGCEQFLGNYGWLAKQAMKQGLCRYSITQKHHLLACRYIEQCRIAAPRLTWCYGPESFMSMCIKIAAACVQGTAAAKMPGKVLDKFAFSYHLLMVGLLDLAEDS